MRQILVIALALLLGGRADAQLDLRNRLLATLAPVVTFDNNTGLFRYSYTITSSAASLQEIDSFEILLRGANVLNVSSPRGWSGAAGPDGRSIIWCACEEEGIIAPPAYVLNGQIIPSIYQVKPGQTLGGFSFDSLFPPSVGTFYASGFVLLPIEALHFPAGGEPPQFPDYPKNSFQGQTQAPERPARSLSPPSSRPLN